MAYHIHFAKVTKDDDDDDDDDDDIFNSDFDSEGVRLKQHQPTAAQKGGLTLVKFLPRWPSMF